jgi:uncharacterized membrane protein
MNHTHRIRRWSAAAAVVVTAGWCGVVRAEQTATPQTLVYAVYDNENTANDAFKAMQQSQREGAIHIDSFAVVSKDQNGRVHVQSNQKHGARAGAIVGALVGLLGGPAGVAVGAGAGGAIGYLTGEAVGIPQQDINSIKASLTPGTSAIIAVVDERWVADLERSLHEAQAKQVLDRRLAGAPAGQAPQGAAPQAAPPGATPEKAPQPSP